MANVKAITINGDRFSVQSTTVEYKPSGQTRTPIVGDGGEIMGYTTEKTAGMIKGKFSILKTADTIKLRDLEDGEIILELTSGINVVGSNCTQIGDNSVVISDSVVEYEFAGDITEN